ncbi:MAG: hypothetical protein EON59_01610 [Alphaproteobacteria bacterium]|nr:MAG: hypothetical protein EON59_01610 [Alphaproteobacteria bacterium]
MSKLRYATWPLAAFLLGFLLLPSTRPGQTPEIAWIGQLGVGIIFATIGLFAAAGMSFLGKRPTGTVLPFYNGTSKEDWVFALALGAGLILKVRPFEGVFGVGLSVMVAMIPVILVMRGIRRR